MSTAFITPRLVRWARQRIRATHEVVASKLRVDRERVVAWEEGHEHPTFRQAHDLADCLNVPFGYLYLSSPPVEKTPLPDLRTLAGIRPRKLSPDFIDTLDDIIRKQEWYREYLEEEGQTRLDFIGKFAVGDDPKRVAEDICHTLGIGDELRDKAPTWEDFLTALVRQCESKGILVFRNGVVRNDNRRPLSVKEFRGFAIADDLAPVVFVNNQDAKTARVFTLIHEVVHLWVGESGISNPNLKTRSSQPSNDTERYCNRVAAEVLIPEDGFKRHWRDDLTTDQNLRQLSRDYKVSTSVVLRRAYELDIIGYSEFLRLVKRDEARWRKIRAKKEDGGHFHHTLLARNSRTLVSVLLEGTLEGRFSPRDAARLLGINASSVRKIGEALIEAG